MFVMCPGLLAVGGLRLPITFLPYINIRHHLSYPSHLQNCLCAPWPVGGIHPWREIVPSLWGLDLTLILPNPSRNSSGRKKSGTGGKSRLSGTGTVDKTLGKQCHLECSTRVQVITSNHSWGPWGEERRFHHLEPLVGWEPLCFASDSKELLCLRSGLIGSMTHSAS